MMFLDKIFNKKAEEDQRNSFSVSAESPFSGQKEGASIGSVSGEQRPDADTSSNAHSPDIESGSFQMQLETIRTRIDAYKEMFNMLSTKITAINEEIGGLKGSITGHETAIAMHDAKFAKTYELVEQVQPQQLKEDIVKVNARIDAIHSKMDIIEGISEKSMEEFKDLRKAVSNIRNLSEIVKLSEELKEDIKTGQKREAEIMREASRVESMHANMKDKYNDFISFKDSVREVEAYFSKLAPLIDKIIMSMPDYVKNNEIAELKDQIAVMEKEAENKIEKISALEERFESWLSDINNISSELAQLRDRLRKADDANAQLRSNMAAKLSGLAQAQTGLSKESKAQARQIAALTRHLKMAKVQAVSAAEFQKLKTSVRPLLANKNKLLVGQEK